MKCCFITPGANVIKCCCEQILYRAYVVQNKCCLKQILLQQILLQQIMFRPNVVQTKYCQGQRLFRTNVVQNKCCLEQMLFRTNVVQNKCCSEQMLFRTNVVQNKCCLEQMLFRTNIVQIKTKEATNFKFLLFFLNRLMLTSYDRHLTAGSATWVDRQLTPTKSPPSSSKVSGLSNTQHIDTGCSDIQ